MLNSRITLCLEGGDFALPEGGRILVFNAGAESDLGALPQERIVAVQGFKPDYDALAGAGYEVVTAPEGEFDMAIVFLPRAKAEARAMIEAATRACPNGLVVVDGQKTDGIDGIFKACRKVADCSAAFSKAHGKTFWFQSVPAFADWAAPEEPIEITPGFVTLPGVFSADGIDPGSRVLIDALPEKLGADIGDFGAGWGWLSAKVLEKEGVNSVHLVEADHAALECAKLNVRDDRAHFHWADVTRYKSLPAFDTIVMNPPFHTSRAADPTLGKAFLSSAAKFLKPRGHLWVVANRHLPYEAHLSELFRTVEEVDGDNRFKVFHATQPAQKTRNI